MAYTEEQKQQALDVYATEGLAAAAKATGASKASVIDWAAKANVMPPERSEQTKAATAEHARIMGENRRTIRLRLAERTLTLLDRIEDEDSPSKCQSLAVAAAVLVDKLTVVGWADGELDTGDGATPDLERMREEARKQGRNLVSVG